MNTLQIVSGNFSAKDNFSAYDDDSERYFVPKRLMETKGWLKDADVKFPFWAKTKVKQIGQLDASGEPLLHEDGTPILLDRSQITSLFLTREELIASCVEKASLPMDIASAIRDRASKAGLDTKTIEQLANAVF